MSSSVYLAMLCQVVGSPLSPAALCWPLAMNGGSYHKESDIAENEKEPTPITTSGAGRKGSSTVRDRYSEDYYQQIGKKGETTLKEKRSSEYYRQIAKKGGQANVHKYGPEHFAEMGKKGGNTTKQRQDPDFYRRIGKMGGAAKKKRAGRDASSSAS